MDKDFEPHFLSSTMVFSSNLRVYAATAMQERRASIREPLERRLLYFSIHQQMCLAMEDLGAHLYAYREKRSGNDYLSALVNYSGSSAYLYDLLKGKNQKQIAAEFGFRGKIPDLLRKAGYDERRQARAAANFYEHLKSIANHQQRRMAICNKLKHGGTIYRPERPERLGILLRDNGKPQTGNISYNEDEVQTFLYVIATCAHQLKEIIFQYFSAYHPTFAEEALESAEVREDMERSMRLIKSLEHVTSRKKAKNSETHAATP